MADSPKALPVQPSPERTDGVQDTQANKETAGVGVAFGGRRRRDGWEGPVTSPGTPCRLRVDVSRLMERVGV